MVSVSESKSNDPRFESRSDHYLDLFLGSSESKSSVTLVNTQLSCLRQVGILKGWFTLATESEAESESEAQGAL